MNMEAHPIRSVRPRSVVPCDIPIRIESEDVAYLCLLRGLRVEIAALTEAQRVAFNCETVGVTLLDPFYVFRDDYVVVLSEHRARYDQVRRYSSFWGRYVHEADAPVGSAEIFYDGEIIRVDESCQFPTERHAESVIKYASYGRPTDQFLFLYHFLELDFDREVISRIRALEGENLNGVGQIIRDLGGGDELGRLQHIIRDMQPSAVWDHAGMLKNHREVSLKVFYEYGRKESNPIKDPDHFSSYFFETMAVREHLFAEIKIRKSISLDFARTFSQSLLKCTAYWIYRVRCCVAHNKLGEYHLMSEEDMRFMEEFALPILRSVVRYRMSKL